MVADAGDSGMGYGRLRWRHKRPDEGGSGVVGSGVASW